MHVCGGDVCACVWGDVCMCVRIVLSNASSL